jgi:hypothetical protein
VSSITILDFVNRKYRETVTNVTVPKGCNGFNLCD